MMSTKLFHKCIFAPKFIHNRIAFYSTFRPILYQQNYKNLYYIQVCKFARAKIKRDIKSKEILQQINEKKSLETELQSYEFQLDYSQVKNLENITSTKGVYSFYNSNEPNQMHPIFKVHILGKLIKWINDERLNVELFTQTDEFKSFYTSMKLGITKMDAKGLSNFIIHWAQLKIVDSEVLEYSKNKIISGNFRQINPQDLSNFLFAYGLANYRDVELLENITKKLEEDQPFNLYIANRNLFALNKLDFYNKNLLDKIEQILVFKKGFT